MKNDNILANTKEAAARKLDWLQRELEELKERLAEKSVIDGPSSAAWRKAQHLVRRMRERDLLFGNDLFSDPAWDILLELFLAYTTKRRVPVSELGAAAAIPQTTKLRWIAKLESCGLVLRKPDPFDGRRVFIELTSRAHERMRSYFGE